MTQRTYITDLKKKLSDQCERDRLIEFPSLAGEALFQINRLGERIAELDDQLLDARFIMGAVEAALWNEDATAVALERARLREWMKRFDAESAS